MNIFTQLCRYILLLYWVSSEGPIQNEARELFDLNVPLQEVTEEPNEITMTPQEEVVEPIDLNVPLQDITEEPNVITITSQESAEKLHVMTITSRENDGEGTSGVKDKPPKLVLSLLFEQKLDHFLSTDTRIWEQRYFVNFQYYDGKGPVFVMVGGLVEIDELDVRSGAWIEYAEDIGAMVFYLEHRFYGHSRPTPDLATEHLVYLNTEQALADLAWFIISQKRMWRIPNGTRWIAFGASYGGTLAARLRLKYPHLIYAVVTSSAPFLEIPNFYEYFEIIDNELKKNQTVRNGIIEAYQLIDLKIKTGGKPELEDMFNTCTCLDIHTAMRRKTISYLFWNLSNILGLVIQYGNNELAALKATVLENMVDESKLNALERFANAIHTILNFYGASCLHVDYDEAIRFYKRTSYFAEFAMHFSLSAGLGNRQNLYQRCTEFGQFETSDQDSGIFGDSFSLNFFVGICIDVFGDGFDMRRLKYGIVRTNSFYGGLNIDVSRLLFANGGQDPWSVLGIIESKTNDRTAVYDENASHCDDIRSAKELPRLRETRNAIFNKLLQWLQE